jgi:hypothetical protein
MSLDRQEDEDSLVRLEQSKVARIVDNDAGEDQVNGDDEGPPDERDIWEVAHVTEPDFETTEGESQELYDKLISGDSMMSGWTPMVPEV